LDFWENSFGNFFLFADERSLKALFFCNSDEIALIQKYIESYQPILKKNKVIAHAIKELSAYFKGKLTVFTVPVNPEGTLFQKKTWEVLQKIKYGQVISYEEQSVRLQKPKAMRAVGQANGKNPIPIIIPCHRVVAKNKTIGGYSGGIMLKQKLLAIENSLLPSMHGN
jgi:methylated-DNA-[protein]-cysteine S-methyltransferase